MAKKITIEQLAEMTQKGFVSVRKDMVGLDGKIQLLNEKMENGFAEIRNEMQQGFRAVIAAIETVEYEKLRMRLSSLETRMDKMERTRK